MSVDPNAETPGDGNPQANAKGRVYSMDASPQSSADDEEIEVAGLREKCGAFLLGLQLLTLEPKDWEERPELRIPRPSPTVTIQSGPKPKGKC
jgi:hypothetical protein